MTPRTTPQEKLERILAAAADFFAERGFANTTVEAIAQRAGVSKGLVYVHFPSKEALLEAVLGKSTTAWFEVSVRAAFGGHKTVPEMLADSLRASIEYARQDPVLRRILAQDPQVLLKRAKGEPEPASDAHIRALRGILAHGVQLGQLRKDMDVERTAQAFALMHGALIREIFVFPRLARGGDGQDLVEAAIDMMLSGLVIRPNDKK